MQARASKYLDMVDSAMLGLDASRTQGLDVQIPHSQARLESRAILDSQISLSQKDNIESTIATDSQQKTDSVNARDSHQGFAHSNISAQSAETESRPLRGAQNREKGGSSASADLELEAEKRGSPLDCRAEGLRAERSKNSGDFFGAKGSGVGINPFLRKNILDSEKIETIRKNEILRNENLKSKQIQNPDCFTYTRNDSIERTPSARNANSATIAKKKSERRL